MIDEMFERTLIIGGTGFIGANLLSEIMRIGGQPTVLTRKEIPRQLSSRLNRKVHSVKIDIRDFEATQKFLKKYKPTLIINAASAHGLENTKTGNNDEINRRAILNILESANRVKTRRIILFGSADEYGYQPIPQKENFALEPNSAYARAKAEITHLAQKMYREEKLPVVILRPFTIYGIDQPPGMFLSEAIKCALSGNSFEMSEGKQKRDYIFISDFVNAVMKAICTSGIEGEVFNIGSGRAFPLKEIALKIWEISGADKSVLKIGARTAGLSELHDTCADISKAKRILQWQPAVTLEDGLTETIKSTRENF